MEPSERRRSGREDLLDAQRILLAAVADVRGALDESMLDILRFNRSEEIHMEAGRDKFSALGLALGRIQEASAKAFDAEQKLGIGGIASDVDIRIGWEALDLHVDLLFADVATHHKIKQALVQAESMARRVDEVLAELGES